MSMVIGKINHNGVVGKRDAIHVPVILVNSKQNLGGSMPVKFTDNSMTAVERCDDKDKHGVVDPFIGVVRAGNPFIVFLSPDLVKNLSHYYEIVIDGMEEENHSIKVNQLKAELKALEDGNLQLIADNKRLLREIDDLEESSNDDDGCRGCY